jgi:EAL domain-containing protein (putative c-di-GMP-specific phosphodiesterase class I)/ActR/RegA family two-component response regulator
VKRLLVLDDDPDMCALVVGAATSAGYQATSSTDFDGFAASLTRDTSVVVLDLMMPEVDGIQVLRYLSSQNYASDIVLISGYDKKVLKVAGQLAEALGLKLRASVQKPVNLKSLQEILSKSGDTKQPSQAGARGSDGSTDPESLRRAITDDQLFVHYQPQYHIKSRKLAGMEALVRWQHPTMGVLPAAAFIEAFETAGLIDELTWLVVRKVLADKKVSGSRSRNIAVSLNISTRSLRDLSLPEKLLSVITHHGGQPADFVLEITESGLIRELHTALDVLARMRLKGFGLSIDDFGTGYAMMQQLQRVPARELKLDMSFTQSMLHDESANIIVRKTLELAHDLDMQVVAEGVETAEQLRALAEYGCEVAQGHWLGRPGAIDALPNAMPPSALSLTSSQ